MKRLTKKRRIQFWRGIAHFILWAIANGRDQDIRFNVIHDINGLQQMEEGDTFFSPRTDRYQREFEAELLSKK